MSIKNNRKYLEVVMNEIIFFLLLEILSGFREKLMKDIILLLSLKKEYLFLFFFY